MEIRQNCLHRTQEMVKLYSITHFNKSYNEVDKNKEQQIPLEPFFSCLHASSSHDDGTEVGFLGLWCRGRGRSMIDGIQTRKRESKGNVNVK